MKREQLIVATLFATLIIPGGAGATTRHVPSSDYPTIHAGLDAAVAGDTVLVGCGVYYEHDLAMPAGVCLRSVAGLPGCVTIDAQREGRVVRCEGADCETVLQGLTLTNGFATFGGRDEDSYLGGGLYCVDSFDGPVVIQCVFLENESVSFGGGVHCGTRGEPVFRYCEFIGNSCINSRFEGNDAPENGGGCCVYGNSSSHLQVWDCDFIGNEADNGGGLHFNGGHLTVTGCLFVENSASFYVGGAVRVHDCQSVLLAGCTMVGNKAYAGSGVHAADCAIDVERTIVAFSEGVHGQGGEGISCSPGGQASVWCSGIFGNEGGDWVGCIEDQLGINGNICEDPLFCDPVSGDFSLQDCSPCAPFSPPNPECDLIGAWPVGCGGTPVTLTTWGGVKALFKE